MAKKVIAKPDLNKLRSNLLKKSVEKDKTPEKPVEKTSCGCSGESSPLKDMVQKIAGLGLPGLGAGIGSPEGSGVTRTIVVMKPAEGVKKVLEKDSVGESTSPFVRKCLKMFTKD